jgi:hypothetical protein
MKSKVNKQFVNNIEKLKVYLSTMKEDVQVENKDNKDKKYI